MRNPDEREGLLLSKEALLVTAHREGKNDCCSKGSRASSLQLVLRPATCQGSGKAMDSLLKGFLSVDAG